MTVKLHVFPPSPRAFKVLCVANHLGSPCELAIVNLAKGEQSRPEFTRINLNGRMPVLQDGDFTLWESNAIVNYLALKAGDATLLPTGMRERMAVEKWQFWESAHWDGACAIFMFERYVKKMFGRGGDVAEIAKGANTMERLAKVLEAELAAHRYIAGEVLTVADFSIASGMLYAEDVRMPLEPYRNLARWRARMQALPGWQKTVAQQKRFSETGTLA